MFPRSTARQAQEAMQARVTLLEGRLRFVENQLAAAGQAPAAAGLPSPPWLTSVEHHHQRYLQRQQQEQQQQQQQQQQALPAPRPFSRLDALLDAGGGAPDAAGWAWAAAASPSRSGQPSLGAFAAPSPGLSAGAPSPGSPWGGRFGAGRSPAAAAAAAALGATTAFGGGLAASARDPCHQQEVEEALMRRGGAGSGAAEGARRHEQLEPRPRQQPQSTQALVDKLAARHAEAQALLHKMRARRSPAACV